MNRIIIVLSCMLFLLLTGNLYAESVKLDEVVVTATRDAQEIGKIPANITIITSEEIKESGATTAVDILNNLAGIHFTIDSGNKARASINMRGFGNNAFGKVLVMVDGRRLNRPDMASINWLQIPINSIERIEVVRGANSVLYGDSAVAGVINIITKKGMEELQIASSVFAGNYGFSDQRLGFSGARDKFRYSFSAETMAESGYRDRSKFLSQGATLNLRYNVKDYLSAFVNTSLTSIDYQLPGGLTKSEVNQNRRQFQPGHDNDDNKEEYKDFSPGIEVNVGDYGRLNINLLYGNKKIEVNTPIYSLFADSTIDTFGITPRYILEKDIFGKSNKLILGIDYYNDTLNVDRFSDRSRATNIAVAKIEKPSLGYYLNNELNLTEQLILSAGIRYEKATLKAKETIYPAGSVNYDDKKEHEGDAFHVGFTYLMGKQSKVFAKYATLYRYPFTDEQASYYGWAGETFNKNLDAEKGKSYEVGTELYPTSNFGGGVTFFWIDMKDEIDWSNLTFQNENLDKTRHQGIEFNSSYRAGSIANLSLNYTYLQANFTSGANDGKKLTLVPDQKAALSLEFFMPYNISLTTSTIYTGEAFLGFDNSNIGEKLSDYTVVNLFCHYRPQTRYGFKAFAGFENLFNEKYSTMGFYPDFYYPAPERMFKTGLSFEL